jgi:hypothetical protein
MLLLAISKPPTLQLTHFFNALKQTMLTLPQNFPTIVLGDFNLNMLDKKNKDTQNLTQFMSQYKMILHFNKTLQFMVHNLIMFGVILLIVNVFQEQ